MAEREKGKGKLPGVEQKISGRPIVSVKIERPRLVPRPQPKKNGEK